MMSYSLTSLSLRPSPSSAITGTSSGLRPAVSSLRGTWSAVCGVSASRSFCMAESPGPTPPYARWDGRDRPTERKTYSKTGKRNVRRQAEPDEFPWNRRVDIVEGKGVPASLGHQRLQFALAAVVRSQNAPAVLKIDKNLAEKQKTTRARKNGGTPTANHGVTASEEGEGNEEDKTAQNKSKNENIGGDTYYPGNFAVLSSFRDVDRRKAMEFHFKIFDDLRLKAAEFPFQDFRRPSRRGRAMTTNDESDSKDDDDTDKSAQSKPKNENVGGRPHYSSGLSSLGDADKVRALCSEGLDVQCFRRSLVTRWSR
ncbi:hypothetical protein LTR75_000508 [Friedmanniomyces endolithicus]|nr:hypothetical protein LTR75_000508 [Friedmanniomyces endolithicus]